MARNLKNRGKMIAQISRVSTDPYLDALSARQCLVYTVRLAFLLLNFQNIKGKDLLYIKIFNFKIITSYKKRGIQSKWIIKFLIYDHLRSRLLKC